MYKKTKRIFKALGIVTSILASITLMINITFGFILPMIPIPMYVGTNIEWLNFIAIFLGSGLTLFGVYWQLKKTKEQQNEDLISNTYATYQLLKNEIDNYIEDFNNPFQIYEIVNLLKTKTKLNEVANSKIDNQLLDIIKTNLQNLCDNFNFKKQDINSYINLSKPSEKVVLLELSNDLSKLIRDIKKTIYNISSDSNGFLSYHLEEGIKDKELNKMNNLKGEIDNAEKKFKKIYSLD